MEPINAEASSHGYGTIKIHMCIFMNENTFSAGFVGEMWKLSVSQALCCPEKALETCRCFEADSPYTAAFSRPSPWVVFTFRSYNFQALDKWVGFFNIWKWFYYFFTFLFFSLSRSRVERFKLMVLKNLCLIDVFGSSCWGSSEQLHNFTIKVDNKLYNVIRGSLAGGTL